MISLAFCLSASNGEINEVNTIMPASFISLATSATLRIFSSLSSLRKPRSPFSPILTLSPSNTIVFFRCSNNLLSISLIRVDFPDPDNPVSQIVFGTCCKLSALFFLVIVICCQTIFLLFCTF